MFVVGVLAQERHAAYESRSGSVVCGWCAENCK
jgi:hypothetical protein